MQNRHSALATRLHALDASSRATFMSRRPCRFTQADVTRALRAAKRVDANLTVEISQDGRIRVVRDDKSASVPVVEYREVVL